MIVNEYEINKGVFLVIASVGNLTFRQLRELWETKVRGTYQQYKDAVKLSVEIRNRIRHNN
jgi:hypothetical protein